jgi:hypothetical protein
MIITATSFLTKRPSRRKAGANSPEVIIRKTCTFCEKRGKSYPIPELLLLANRAGFLWLSKVFADCAAKKPEAKNTFEMDPDDHEHLDQGDPQINPVHSDELAFRLGLLTRTNRRAVFNKYGVAQLKPFKGDLVSQYQRQIAQVQSQWRRMLAFDRQWRKREEHENRLWKTVLDRLRRKQKRNLNRAAGAKSARPQKMRRLFRGWAELEVGPGFRRPQNHGAPEPLRDGSTMVKAYVFARSSGEASRQLADGLKSAGYKVTKVSEVAPNRSSRPWAMDDRSIRPEDVLRAWDTEEVLLGWFM